jgi:YesN/AraC family two-component response regulator
MPEISGLALAEQVSARYPHLSILLASGYSEALKTETRFKVLRKPFHLATLETELSKVLKRA